VCILINFFEGKVDFEASPGAREVASAVIVGGVRGCVSIFVFDEIKVPPYNEVGRRRDKFLEGGKLNRLRCEARRGQVDIEGCKGMCAILGEKLNTQSISIEGCREGNYFVVV
jgi:hypothetical protein